MAHKKGASSSRNGRDSNPQYLGVTGLGGHAAVEEYIRDEKPARALVLKTKPMYVFMNLLFQKTIEKRPTEAAPGGEDFEPRPEPHYHEHDHDHGHEYDHEVQHA